MTKDPVWTFRASEDLVRRFDRLCKSKKGFRTRSKGVRNLMELALRAWEREEKTETEEEDEFDYSS
jgi:metal-responsive CopG/Arc/MetJ family transcriptional regulator